MSSHDLQCMEVWGGNHSADGAVTMSGLDAWIYSEPYRGDAGGGDVYYVSSCATGRITRMLVADVARPPPTPGVGAGPLPAPKRGVSWRCPSYQYSPAGAL